MKTLWIAVLAISVAAPLWAQTVTTAEPEPARAGLAASPATVSASSKTAGVIPDSTKLEVVKSRKADYPLTASRDGIQGQVWLKFEVSEDGDVADIETISGEPILAESATNALKNWKFKPFIRDGKPVKVTSKLPFDFFFSGKVFDKGKTSDGTAVAEQPTTKADLPANAALSSANPAGETQPGTTLPTRVRVSQGVSQALLIHQIAPVYPDAARRNRVQGAVVLHAVIGKDGRILDLRPTEGRPELIPAAVGAVQQWRYKPYYLKGEPVEVETQITVNFALR